MSLRRAPRSPAPQAPSPSAPTDAAPTPEGPLLTGFAVVKHGDKWVGLAVETKGTRVVRTKVLSEDTSARHVRHRVEQAEDRLWEYDESPWPGP